VLAHAGYRIQTYFPDFMETSNPVNDNATLAAEVNKSPSPSGGYLIAAQFYCTNDADCASSARDTLDQFNRVVSAADAPILISAQSPTTAAK
jgi:hypothetical protein